MPKTVSVPYRGILFFNRSTNFIDKSQFKFPSPIGESYFSIRLFTWMRDNGYLISVPYRGILFFNMPGRITENRISFPSPIGESYFSIILVLTLTACKLDFRPLSGNLIFQL